MDEEGYNQEKKREEEEDQGEDEEQKRGRRGRRCPLSLGKRRGLAAMFFAPRGPLGKALGALLGRLEGLLGRLEVILGRLEAKVGRLGAILDRVGDMLASGARIFRILQGIVASGTQGLLFFARIVAAGARILSFLQGSWPRERGSYVF